LVAWVREIARLATRVYHGANRASLAEGGGVNEFEATALWVAYPCGGGTFDWQTFDDEPIKCSKPRTNCGVYSMEEMVCRPDTAAGHAEVLFPAAELDSIVEQMSSSPEADRKVVQDLRRIRRNYKRRKRR
jgi:hypothetical protein